MANTENTPGPRNLSPEVANALRLAASALVEACQYWGDNDQAAFDISRTEIRRAFGLSLDEAAMEIAAFVEEAEYID